MNTADLFGLLSATSAALLGGLAIAYAHFVWTHGNGFRRWMRWLAPAWSALAFYYAAIWTWDAFDEQAVDTIRWLRPVGWLVWLIPALTLFNALREDTAHREEERKAERRLAIIRERLNRG